MNTEIRAKIKLELMKLAYELKGKVQGVEEMFKIYEELIKKVL